MGSTTFLVVGPAPVGREGGFWAQMRSDSAIDDVLVVQPRHHEDPPRRPFGSRGRLRHGSAPARRRSSPETPSAMGAYDVSMSRCNGCRTRTIVALWS
jgi:hypothetical protein